MNQSKSGLASEQTSTNHTAPTKNVVDTMKAAGNLTTFAAGIKAAGLANKLAGKGPFTVFAPTDDAFAKLPAGTVDNLVQPENKAALTKVLTYHVVPGTYSTAKLMKEIKSNGGTLKLKTVEGDELSFMMANGGIKITDDKGGSAMITTANVYQSNGVIQVVDSVLMP